MSRAVRELLSSSVGDTLLAACGPDATLHELAALISSPGASPQPLHADTLWCEGGCLFTSFVALQPVSRELGPTRFLKRTHTADAHEQFEKAVNDGKSGEWVGSLPTDHATCGLLELGEATLYDGRLLHGGSSNVDAPSSPSDGEDRSEEGVRVLFYLTFARAAAEAEELGNEEAHSLISGYRGRFTLGRLLAN